MLETKQQKKYFVTAMVLVVILSLVSFWDRGNFNFVDNKDYNKPDQTQLQAQAYLDYLNSVKVDPEASKVLFEELISEQDIKKMVEEDLQIDQKIEPPTLDNKVLSITNASGSQAIADYLDKAGGHSVSFALDSGSVNGKLFTGDPAAADAILEKLGKSYDQLLQVPVPKEAVELHKSLLLALDAYKELAKTSKTYDIQQNTQPWPNVYRYYNVMNDELGTFNSELNRLVDKYKIAEMPVHVQLASEEVNPTTKHLPFVKTAHALFGVGDTSIVVADIPKIIRDAIEEGLAASFATFMSSLLNRVIEKIESNYLIANFLYYSDALVTGQYANDYLNKYVSNELDRQLVKKMMPQFTCGTQPQNLQPVFQAKAQQYLGFDPVNIDPKSSTYYQDLARVGNFFSSSQGQKLYFEDLAEMAKGEAEKAAERELISPGLKTPRDALKNNLVTSINSIVSAQRASFNAMMQLGIGTAKNFISKFVATITQTLVTKFVFKGASGNTSAVLKEQSTCLAAAQLQVVLPVGDTTYQEPAKVPTREELLRQECSQYSGGCPDTNNPAVPGPN